MLGPGELRAPCTLCPSPPRGPGTPHPFRSRAGSFSFCRGPLPRLPPCPPPAGRPTPRSLTPPGLLTLDGLGAFIRQSRGVPRRSAAPQRLGRSPLEAFLEISQSFSNPATLGRESTSWENAWIRTSVESRGWVFGTLALFLLSCFCLDNSGESSPLPIIRIIA